MTSLLMRFPYDQLVAPPAHLGIRILRAERPWRKDPTEAYDRALRWPVRLAVIAALAGLSWIAVAALVWLVGLLLP